MTTDMYTTKRLFLRAKTNPLDIIQLKTNCQYNMKT